MNKDSSGSGREAILVVIAIILGIIGYSKYQDFKNLEKKEVKTFQSIELEEIYEEYKSNEVRAKQNYEGNFYNYNGIIKKIDTDIFDRPMLEIIFECKAKETCTALVYFNKEESDKISKLNTGDNINFSGKVDGGNGLFNDVTIDKANVK